MSGRTTSFSFPAPGQVIWNGVFPGRLYPLSRPRFVLGHVYQPLENQKELRAWMRGNTPEIVFRADVWVDCFFLFKGKTEPDCDNLLKAVNDGLQSCGIIVNDRRIVGGSFLRGFSTEDATHIIIREVIRRET